MDIIKKFKTRDSTLPEEQSQEALGYMQLEFVSPDFSSTSETFEKSTDLVQQCNNHFKSILELISYRYIVDLIMLAYL